MTTHLELAKLLEATLTPFRFPVELDELMKSVVAEGGHAGLHLTPTGLPASDRRQIQSVQVQNLRRKRNRAISDEMRAQREKSERNPMDFDRK